MALTIPQTVQPSERRQQLYSASQTLGPHDQRELLFCLQTEPPGAHWSEVGTGDSLFRSLTYNMRKRHTKNVSGYSKISICIKIILKVLCAAGFKIKDQSTSLWFLQDACSTKDWNKYSEVQFRLWNQTSNRYWSLVIWAYVLKFCLKLQLKHASNSLSPKGCSTAHSLRKTAGTYVPHDTFWEGRQYFKCFNTNIIMQHEQCKDLYSFRAFHLSSPLNKFFPQK